MNEITKITLQDHNDVLEKIAEILDIPESMLEKAIRSYQSMGNWLGRPESTLAQFDPMVSPQGSILLGTVIRPITDKDEFDVDLVCTLNATKRDFTQKSLKSAVGHEVELYAKSQKMKNPPEDGRRCWTMIYANGAQFHMDILPALPDPERYREVLESRGFTDLAKNVAITDKAIAITDKTSANYAEYSNDWPQSNPAGYAEWFRERMRVRLLEQKTLYAKRHAFAGSVDDVPDHKVKTPLQRAIQLLKRHRDIMFDDDEDKPISIIITTLSAHSYNNEDTIPAALASILTTMASHIEERDGVFWIVNPVNPAENFADKWAEEPQKRVNFFSWLEQAQNDFGMYLNASAFDEIPQVLEEGLGTDLVKRSIGTSVAASAAAVSAPSIITSSDRAEAAINRVLEAGTQSRPWAK